MKENDSLISTTYFEKCCEKIFFERFEVLKKNITYFFSFVRRDFERMRCKGDAVQDPGYKRLQRKFPSPKCSTCSINLVDYNLKYLMKIEVIKKK